ncbi:MAG: hypothetical protein AABX12_03870 [Nanoarchaeota archaeon]
MVERKEIKIGKLETKTGSQSFTEKFIVVNGPTCLEVYGCDADHRGIVERFGLNQSQVLGGAAYSFRDGELLIRNQSSTFGGVGKEAAGVIATLIARALSIQGYQVNNSGVEYSVPNLIYEDFYHATRWRNSGFNE